MVKLAILLFGATLCTIALAKPEQDKNLKEIDSIYQEEHCVMQGGTCVKEADCPEPTAVKGLCPEQRARGVECCYGISEKETRCQRRGGICTSDCNPKMITRLATDCPGDSLCCILV